ncbi:Arabinose import ATP-binding protein AraG [Austwickia sp. TVS 96-490-7B]|uniref:sugar ABC transporter ATP-binding protein n=1 Tax=Austwickia sp. TVS 96-490-7B TaxID=2830843 RepID=UPI001C5A1754|nr:sugar ABC transporter ATP-binding protein [Austwickia sp. TVS 96-490-7B]MBW3085020.1 Arabinose import ATP-binding protein AraG [Austwickia sp. TVS 96-490-7B]
MSDCVLALHGVSKSFNGVAALHGVDLELRAGEVHVLLGENGAGKSTLIKIIAGVHQPDQGEIHLDGDVVRITDTATSERCGIATIHQELNLVPTLSVAENITLGRTPRRHGLIDRAEMRRYARAALDRVGLDVDVDRPAGSLGIARQQLVEIARALAQNARILILDEPTAALTRTETDILFDIVRELRAAGVAMVFISHHLDEIAEIGDRITVLRDGKYVDTVSGSTSEDELVRLMVGRDIDDLYPRRAGDLGETLLDVRNLSSTGLFDDITLQVRAGEVVGLAGLMGAGRTELLRAIAGADRYDAGEIRIADSPLPRHDVAAAVRAGVGLVPEDRKTSGLVLGASITDNLGYATLRPTARGPLADLNGQRERGVDVADTLRLRRASMTQQVRSLSGGNQQKVVFGRWFMAGTKVLLLDEPTRGVDVGAKVEIYELINRVTAAGGAVLLASSELPEVISMSDRVLVMARGRLVGELPAAQASQDAVMSLAVKEVESTRVH